VLAQLTTWPEEALTQATTSPETMALLVLAHAASFPKQLDASVPVHLRKFHRCVAAASDGWRPAPQVTDEPSLCSSIAVAGSKG